jgi:2-methylcitrate dehydratase PrpD
MPTQADLTQRLVAHGQRAQFSHLPADVVQLAKHCVLDWLGVTLAGAREPAARMLFESICRSEGGTDATLLGFGRRGSLRTAALLNGTAAHALDYDDTHWGLQGHPTAPVLSALFALAEREAASGQQLIAALVAGIEVECRLGQWLNPSHYARGYHATATLGAFGGAAAAAHLLQLPTAAWACAFGLAGTQAAGLKSAFGTLAKPLQVGRAAETGLLSALLAAGGFSANPHILEDAQGFAVTHADPPAEDAQPDAWLIRGTLFKYHAACYLTHSTIDGLRALLQEHAFQARDVRQVRLVVDETCLSVCNIERPRTGTEAKFSLRAAAALTLLGHATHDPRTFEDALVQSSALSALCERVSVSTAPLPATRSRVYVELAGGRTLSVEHDSGVPEADLARQERRLCDKLDGLLPLQAAGRGALRACVLHLEHLNDVRELARLASAEV